MSDTMDRVLDLLAQLQAEFAAEHDGSDRGWRAWAARKTGLSAEYVQKLEKRERRAVSLPVFDKLVATLGISRAFFDAPAGSDYRGFLVGVGEPAAFRYLRQNFSRFAELTQAHLAHLKALASQPAFRGDSGPQKLLEIAIYLVDGEGESLRGSEVDEKAASLGVRKVRRRTPN